VSTLDQQFEKAINEVTELANRPENKHMLTLYASYKQATQGDCTGKRPGMLDIAGRAKYDAWKKISGTKTSDAKQAYVDLVTILQNR